MISIFAVFIGILLLLGGATAIPTLLAPAAVQLVRFRKSADRSKVVRRMLGICSANSIGLMLFVLVFAHFSLLALIICLLLGFGGTFAYASRAVKSQLNQTAMAV